MLVRRRLNSIKVDLDLEQGETSPEACATVSAGARLSELIRERSF
jgi:hypothetical protein